MALCDFDMRRLKAKFHYAILHSEPARELVRELVCDLLATWSQTSCEPVCDQVRAELSRHVEIARTWLQTCSQAC